MVVPRRLLAFIALVASIASLLAALPVSAQEDYSTRLGISIGAGAAKYGGDDKDHLDLGTTFGGGVRLGWRRNIDIGVNLRYAEFQATSLPDTMIVSENIRAVPVFKNQSTTLDFSLLYSLYPDKSWTPQVFGGAGVVFWQVVDFTLEPSSGWFGSGPVPTGLRNNGDPEVLTNTNYTLFVGLGGEVQLLSTLYLHAAGRADFLPKQDIDNTGASVAFRDPDRPFRANEHADANNWLGSVTLGLTYFFSERDSDQDGVPNDKDPCPYGAEDVDGFEDADGCPDPDNDGDGILDVDDASPDEPEDMDGFEDDDGAPDPDNDGDGILDADDQCPEEAEDIDGFEDADGCPDADNDGDGVLDADDQCADTPTGVPVDASGCPTAERLDQEKTLSRVKFLPNSNELDPASFVSLDSIVTSLLAFPDLEIEIQVHTDDLGPDDRNLAASQDRAEVIAQYFMSKGVSPQRLTPIGYGETSPIAPNDTPENRAMNERVVIVPVQAVPLESMDELDDDLEIELPPDD